jgi:hypothetical protein
MDNFKNKLYNYESSPPSEVWDKINAELSTGQQGVLPMMHLRKRSKFIFYGLTAAASLIIIFLSSIVFNTSRENKFGKKSSGTVSGMQSWLSQKIKDSIQLNNKTLEDIIRSSKDKNLIAQNYESPYSHQKKYITISGPGGQPVKISPKVATLIVSADNEDPPKPIWDKKIERWKQIMLNTTLSPTSTNLLDIAQLTSNLDNNE